MARLSGMNRIQDQIDHMPLGRQQAVLIGLMIIALILDGLDVKLLSYVTPTILEDWKLSEAIFSPALAAALVGMAGGSWIGGWMGDRWGRRNVILGMLLLFGVATIAVAHAQNVATLAVFRLVSGFGFGALAPNALALSTEWVPRRLQPKVVAFLSASSPLGGAIGAFVALWGLPALGWRGCFIVIGVITIIFALTIRWWLPESIYYLVMRAKFNRAALTWRLMFGTELVIPPGDKDQPAQAKSRGRTPLFVSSLSRLNAGSFLCFFSAYYVSYAFSSWLPVILTTSGFAISTAINGSLAYNSLAIIGALISGNLIGRFGSRTVLTTTATIYMVALAALCGLLKISIGTTQTIATLTLVSVCGAGAGMIASTISAVVASAYPPELRATGVGFGVMAGRIGGITTTLGGGVLLTIGQNDVAPLFIVLIFMCVLILLSTFVIDQHICVPSSISGRDAA